MAVAPSAMTAADITATGYYPNQTASNAATAAGVVFADGVARGLSASNDIIVAAIGDSRLNHDMEPYTVTPGSVFEYPNDAVGMNAVAGPKVGKVAGYSSLGIRTYLQALSFGQIRCPNYGRQYTTGAIPNTQVAWSATYNQAVGGTTTGAFRYQLDRLLAITPRPTICAMLSGYNDLIATIATVPAGAQAAAQAVAVLANMKANYIAAWQRLTAAGIQPVVVVDPPANFAGFSTVAELRKTHQALRQWQRDTANSYGAWFVDPAMDLADPNSANGESLAAMYATDVPRVHPGPRGALAIAKTLFTLLGSKGKLSVPYYGQSREDAYDATLTPRGNLLPDGGLMIGTSGTKNGGADNTGTGGLDTRPSGTVPNGWQVRNNGGNGTIVCSVQPRVNGQGQDLKIVVTATTDTEFQAYYDLSNVAAGDVIAAAIEVNLDASVTLDRLNIYVDEFDSALANSAQRCGALNGATASSSGLMPTTFAGRFTTEQMLLGVAGCKVRLMVSGFVTAGGSATLRIGAAEVRKVAA